MTANKENHAIPTAVWDLVRRHRGVFLAGALLVLVNRTAGLALPASTKFLVDRVLEPRRYDLIFPLCAAVLGATTLQGFTSFWLLRLFGRTAQLVIADFRENLYRHIMRLSLGFHDSYRTGNLISRIINDVEGLRNLVGIGLIEFGGGLITAVVAFCALLRISPAMTGLAALMIVLFGFALNRALRTIRPIARERSEIHAELVGRLNESLGGIRIVKGYRAEEGEGQVFIRGSRRLLANAIKALTANSILTASATMLVGVSGTLIIYVGARQIEQGVLTIGGFSAFAMFLVFLISPMVQVVTIGVQFTEALAGLDRTTELLRMKPEDADPERAVRINQVAGSVQFRNVSFSYTSSAPVLHDICFEAPAGSVTALVGTSGSGKSTITSLIAAFYKPVSGSILVDSIDLSTVTLDSFRRQLGLVLQETFLFDGTIRDNILFANPRSTEEELIEACRIARVDEFVNRFGQGYETVVGERGVRLSGGQRQRIAIARAVLANPAILILDEATSSLDSESEAHIQEGLKYLMRGRTTFVIAHRLSTIKRADQILVIEAGRVVERGSHGELCAQRGRYFDLYSRQRGVESNLFLAPGEGDAPIEDEPADMPIEEPVDEPGALFRITAV